MTITEALEFLRADSNVRIFRKDWLTEESYVCVTGEFLYFRQDNDCDAMIWRPTLRDLLATDWVVRPQPSHVELFGFARAIDEMLNGEKVRRKGWQFNETAYIHLDPSAEVVRWVEYRNIARDPDQMPEKCKVWQEYTLGREDMECEDWYIYDTGNDDDKLVFFS